MSAQPTRCFLCAARMLAPTTRALRWPGGFRRRFALACGSCGVLTDGAEGPAALAHLGEALSGEVFALGRDAPYGLDPYTLRTAATRWRRAASPVGEAQRRALGRPHSDLAAEGQLSDMVPGEGPEVAIGVMCRSGEWEGALGHLRAHLRWASGIVILADGAGPDLQPEDRVLVSRRDMDGDFAAQRNALQDLSPSPWMLQLDTDETLDPDAAALLPALAGLADAGDAVSVGLPRRNLVDGVAADLYPDTQYRLNRRETRFTGRVHERPERPWQRSVLSLHGTIDHHLERARVETRSQAYEAMVPGGGRLEEAQALLQPFRD